MLVVLRVSEYEHAKRGKQKGKNDVRNKKRKEMGRGNDETAGIKIF